MTHHTISAYFCPICNSPTRKEQIKQFTDFICPHCEAVYRLCSECHQIKPLIQFYRHKTSKRGHLRQCISCWKVMLKSKDYHSLDKSIAGNMAEQLVIQQLRQRGIYAAPGKSSEYIYVDVVALGCVRIEVKQADYQKRCAYLFNFTPQKFQPRLEAELVVLVLELYGDWSYHVFPADHPVFFKNGRIKSGVQYLPNPKHCKRINTVQLTHPLMMEHKDAWYLVEDVYRQMSAQMRGEPIPELSRRFEHLTQLPLL